MEDPAVGTTLEQLLAVFRRRWRVFPVCAILVAAAALGLSSLERNEYTASSSLLFTTTQYDQELFGTLPAQTQIDPTRQAATNLQLVSLPVIASKTAGALNMSPTVVSGEVSVSEDGQADVVQVSATNPSPARAATIANTYAQQYIDFRQQAARSDIAGAETLVNKKLAELPPAQRSGSVGVALQNRSNQLGTMAALQTGNAELVQAATVPKSPSSPQPLRNAVLGLVAGLILGIGLILLMERLDRRVHDASELENLFGVPVLGAIPDSPAYQRSGAEPLPPVESEAFALLRARLRYFNVDREIRSLLMTSAFSGEGKTTVALNLALTEALAGQQRAVLVEADLRRPTLARRLPISSGPGLAEVLSRNATLEAALHTVMVPGTDEENSNGSATSLSVIPAGAIPPNPAELLESRAMIDLLSTLSERFDLVIIDTPPTMIVSDAIPLMRLVSGVLIVSHVDQTTRDAARHLREQLAKLRAPALGVVANAVPAVGRGYSDYLYYQDGYPARDQDDEFAADDAEAPDHVGAETTESTRNS